MNAGNPSIALIRARATLRNTPATHGPVAVSLKETADRSVPLRLARSLGLLAGDWSGNIAIATALMLPVLLLAAGGTIDYMHLSLQKQRLQSAVDAAALSAARELHLVTTDQNQVQAAVESALKGNLGPDATNLRIKTKLIDDPLSLSVTATQTGEVFFLTSQLDGKISAGAVARVLSGSPLCVLGLDDNKKKAALTLEKNAHLTASNCAVYSNSKNKESIKSEDGAFLEAEFICTAGGKVGSKGNFEPDPVTDCPQVPDPLAGRAAPPVGSCTESGLRIGLRNKDKIDEKLIKKLVKEELEDESGKDDKRKNKKSEETASDYDSYDVVLKPGVYCGGLLIGSASNVTFEPGVYVLKDGPLYVADFATMEAKNVGFYFAGKKSNLYFGPNTTISITAPTDGPMAGLLMFEDRGAAKLRPYAILSDGARVLEGTVYLPQSHLYIDADAPIADKSAYTAIIARRIELYAGPHLVLNSDYDLTDVPVPFGVGNNRGVVLDK